VLIFIIVALVLVMSSVDSTIVSTALHSLQHDLHTSINWAGWTLTAYSFGIVLMLPLSGRLSEQYGRRRVFLGSVITFTAASLCCGLVDNIYALIALRAVQAAGGAGFTPSATGIIVDHFGRDRDRAISLFGSIFPIGAMIGPALGGLFVTYWSWRGIFLVNVPIGIVVIAMTLRHIPRDRAKAERLPLTMDTPGMVLLGVGLFAGMFAISYLGQRNAHPLSPLFVAPVAVAIGVLWMFFRHVHRTANPFIAPDLIHGPGFGTVNLVNALYGGISNGIVALIPFYATNRYAIDAFDSGTLLVAQGAATVLVTVVAALVIRRSGYRLPIYIGGLVVIAGMLLLALSPLANIPPYGWLAGSAVLVGAGGGMLNPASRNAGLQLAPEKASTLAALRTMCLQIGTISTIAVATAVLAGSDDPGGVQARFDVVGALLLLVALPLISRIPEHRGSW
jgi:MFS family permease